MPRFHHTNAEALDLTRKYEQTFFKKPLGLWYDIDCSWSDWCKHNEYGSGYRNHFLLEIDFENVLVIDSMEKLKTFDIQFGYVPDELKGLSGDFRRIDLARLAKHYTGIEIAPYQEEATDLGRYAWYNWDVASGCLWDLSVIKSVKQMSDRDIHIEKNY